MAYRDGVETGRASLVTAGTELVLAASADRAEITADTGDLAFVAIALQDAAGVLMPISDRFSHTWCRP